MNKNCANIFVQWQPLVQECKNVNNFEVLFSFFLIWEIVSICWLIVFTVVVTQSILFFVLVVFFPFLQTNCFKTYGRIAINNKQHTFAHIQLYHKLQRISISAPFTTNYNITTWIKYAEYDINQDNMTKNWRITIFDDILSRLIY